MPMPAVEFSRLLSQLVAEFGGTKQDFARAVGITPSTLSHLLRGDSVAPSTEVCLRMATATGASASRVLRAAGKGSVADLIEDLYGSAATRRHLLGFRLTPLEEKHMSAVRALAPKAQRAYFTIVEHAAAAGRIGPRRRAPRVAAARNGTN